MTNEARSCKNCIWNDSCAERSICEDYSPADDVSRDTTYYDDVLDEDMAEYQDFMSELGVTA